MTISRQTVMNLDSDVLAERVEAAFAIIENFPEGHPELWEEFTERIRMSREKPILKANYGPYMEDIENPGDYVDRATAIKDVSLREKVLRTLAFAKAKDHKNVRERAVKAYLKDYLAGSEHFDCELLPGNVGQDYLSSVIEKHYDELVDFDDPVLKIKALTRLYSSRYAKNQKSRIEGDLTSELTKNARSIFDQRITEEERTALYNFIVQHDIPGYVDMARHELTKEREATKRQEEYQRLDLNGKLCKAFGL
ncbi:hypothetical protein KY361_06215 [Candidatus Woesearchaeota archaeon]|nr:hypothetical protein [Candidatus Woesearchaeota archaeon]